MLTPKQTANFFKKVMPEPNTGCWFWTGAQNQGRARKARGEANGNSRLTVHGVQRIRDMADVGYPPKHMAEMFQINVTQVRRIIRRGAGGWQ